MNESILLVEDEKALRTTLSDRLRSEGYVVETATDGREGFDKASSHPFDLIILDVMLPRRNGLDVCRDIRAAGMATPILILTVRNETVDKVVGLKLGADDYVTKPFEASELLARIEVLLRRVPIHFQLLRYLMERVGTTVTREELLRSVWGYDADTFTRTVDTHIASLRQKLEQNPKKPEFILAVSGVGYRFVGRDSK